MSRKEELEKNQAALSEKWHANVNELKKLKAEEDFMERCKQFANYKFKCTVNYDGTLSSERRDITPNDIKQVQVRMGIPEVFHSSGSGHSSGGDYAEVFLVDTPDWERVNKLFSVLTLVREIESKCCTDEKINKLLEMLK